VFHKATLYRALKPSQGVEPESDSNTWELLPKPKPTTPDAEVERVKMGLLDLGYIDLERKSIRFLLRPGEIIKRFDAWSVTTDRRVINRENIRPVLRPVGWTREDTWLAQFPPIPKRPEELAASRALEQPDPRKF
jgi:hypothetical protein